MFLKENGKIGTKNAELQVTETGHYDHNILANVKVMI